MLTTLRSWLLPFLLFWAQSDSLAQPVANADADRWTKTAAQFSDKEYDSAVYYLRKAKEARVLSKDWQHAAILFSRLIAIENQRENYTAAEETLSEALMTIADKKISDSKTLSNFYNEAGALHYNLGDYELAIRYMKRSLEWHLQSNDDPIYLAIKYNNIGSVLNRLGDYDEAILNFNKSLSIYVSKDPASLDVAEGHTNLGGAYYRKRDYHQAKEHLQKGLEIFEQLKGQDLSQLYINSYNSMALSHAELGEYDAALEFLRKALLLQRKSEFMVARTHHNLGYVYRLMNNQPQATFYLKKAIQENTAKYGPSHPDIGKAYRHIGAVHAARGGYDSALQYYQQALTIIAPGFKDLRITANPTIGPGINSKPDLLRTLNTKGKALLELSANSKGKTDYLKTAFETYQKALELLDLMRGEYELEDSRRFINEDAMPVYNNAMQVAMALYEREHHKPAYLEAAFSISERSRALLLLESLQYRESKALLGVPDSLLLKEKTLKRQIAYYENQLVTNKTDSVALQRNKEYLAAKQQAYRKLTDNFKTRYPAYYNSKFTSPASLQTLQQTLPDTETALVEYFLGEEQLHSIIVTHNGATGYSAPRPADTDSLLTRYRKSLSDIAWIMREPQQARAQYIATARTLYSLLIEPLTTRLPATVRHLAIVPQGGLDQISFDALLTRDVAANVKGYKQLPYLFQQYTIQQAYSASAYCKLKGESTTNAGVQCLAFAPGFEARLTIEAAPVMLSTLRDGEQALPGTQKEIDGIARYFDGKAYRGAQATELNFKKEAGTYAIIHLATHGRADNEMPGRSHLLFTRQGSDTTEDNTLYAYEIANLSLQADLVVLSGCETGYGIITRGEGIMSLGRSFIHAGSKSVLTSLWKIDDDASATLMSHFYAALADELSKPEAMNKARQEYLAQADDFKAHPFFWAAFTFTGDDRPMETRSNTLYYVLAVAGIAIAALIYAGFKGFNMRRQSKY